MVLVTGSIIAQPGQLDAVLALSLAHVRRSRAEPGCISHAVHHDAENPQKLVFIEEWADRAALAAHFAVPTSGQFVCAASALAAASPQLNLYDATPFKL